MFHGIRSVRHGTVKAQHRRSVSTGRCLRFEPLETLLVLSAVTGFIPDAPADDAATGTMIVDDMSPRDADSLGGVIPAATGRAGTAVISGELKEWHKITFTWAGPLTSETADPNPFLDYRLDVTLTSPGGEIYVVPGYYAADGNAANTHAAGGKKWRAHFAPSETGQWTYRVSFRAGTGVAVADNPWAGASAGYFDGDTGTFDVLPTDKTGRDMRGKGMLEYVGKRYLRFAGTGEYFLKQGADAPENLLAYADFDGSFKSDGRKDDLIKDYSPHVADWNPGDPTWDADRDADSSADDGKGLIGAVNYLASEGLNAFSFLPMNINGDDRNVFPYLDYDERYRMDVSKLDQWEIVFEHATEQGFFLHFKTQERENQGLLDGGALGTQRKLYYRELIARFSHHPALNWNLGEEIDTPPSSTAEKQAWADYFWNTDPYHHHIVIHNGSNHYDLMGPYNEAAGTGSELTGFSLQTGSSDFSDVHGKALDYINRSANAGKPWAVAVDEPGDASHALRPDDDQGSSHTDGRKNALWGALMAGGWGNEWYFGYSHTHSDLTLQDFRSRDDWWDYTRYALGFFTQNDIPFWEMANNNSISSASNDYGFCRPGDTYVVYLKNGGTTNLDLRDASGTFDVRWFDPRNGGGLQVGSVARVTGGGWVGLGQAPNNSNKDWAILITRTGAGGDPLVSITAADASADEQGGDPGRFRFLLSEPLEDDLSISYTVGGTAKTADYTETLSGTVTIPQGATSVTLDITPVDDDDVEYAETVVLTLRDGEGYAVGFPATATVTIADSDQPDQASFSPVDDAYLENGARHNNEYLKTETSSSRDRVSYLKFAVDAMEGRQVTAARLRLTVQGDPGNGTLSIHSADGNNWTEGNLSTSNAPTPREQLDSASGSHAIGNVVEFDVSSFVDGDGVYSFVLEIASGSNDVWFGSSEGAAPPELIVESEAQVPIATVESVVVNHGRAQRSTLSVIEVYFSQVVSILDGAFQVGRRGDAAWAEVICTPRVENGKTVAELTFTGSMVDASGSLLDGEYVLLVDGSKVLNADGVALDGDADGFAGGFYAFGAAQADAFFRRSGDFTGDGVVDNADLDLLRTNWGRFAEPGEFLDGDASGDGVVNSDDLNLIRANWDVLAADVARRSR